MAQIKKLKDNNNNTVYPMTQASAVFLNNGERLSDDYFLIKDLTASDKSVSKLFNNAIYFNDKGFAIQDPTLYLIKIKVNGQQQLTYCENPLNGFIASDFDSGNGFSTSQLVVTSFTDGKIYASTKEFSFAYDKSSNSASLETGQNDIIRNLEWIAMAS